MSELEFNKVTVKTIDQHVGTRLCRGNLNQKIFNISNQILQPQRNLIKATLGALQSNLSAHEATSVIRCFVLFRPGNAAARIDAKWSFIVELLQEPHGSSI